MAIQGWNLYAMRKIWEKREAEGDFIRSAVTQKEIDEWTEKVTHQLMH